MSYDDPVKRFWPEYACNGKENTTIEHVLTHSVSSIVNRKRVARPSLFLAKRADVTDNKMWNQLVIGHSGNLLII